LSTRSRGSPRFRSANSGKEVSDMAELTDFFDAVKKQGA
jgi:hypothetical protein